MADDVVRVYLDDDGVVPGRAKKFSLERHTTAAALCEVAATAWGAATSPDFRLFVVSARVSEINFWPRLV